MGVFANRGTRKGRHGGVQLARERAKRLLQMFAPIFEVEECPEDTGTQHNDLQNDSLVLCTLGDPN